MALTPADLIRKGRWTEAVLNLEDKKALDLFFSELLKDAREETKDVPDSNAFKDQAVNAYVQYQVYAGLVLQHTTNPASQSQPEYSRSMLQSQIDDLIKQRDKYWQEFTGLMSKAKPDSVAANIREMERV